MSAPDLPPGKIIVLNGPSSSGKSTLARALQAELDEPFLRFSFDLFIEGRAFPAGRKFPWAEMRPAVFRGLHRCLPALASAGNNVLFDHIIETRAGLLELADLLAGLDVFLVGLHCSLAELERREAQRGDRHPGEARRDLETVQRITPYDLEVNSEEAPEENAHMVFRAWRERRRPSALEKVRG